MPFVEADLPTEPEPGTWYRHYKGKRYQVHGLAVHSETEELLVLYSPEGSQVVWARPHAMWFEPVKTPAGSVPRFRRDHEIRT